MAESEQDRKLRAKALERYEMAVEHERENREAAEDDLRFAAGDQWEEAAKSAREKDGRPCLTINRMGQFVRQVTGDVRMNRPAIKVRPVDDKADPKLAEAFTGHIRHIEQCSDAQTAYNTALENAAICSQGAFRITTEYAEGTGFNLELYIRRIRSPFAVLWDPAAQELTREDADYCFVVNYMSREGFKATWPKAKDQDWEVADDRDAPQVPDGWFSDHAIRIVEYWVKSKQSRSIALMNDASVVDVTDLDNAAILQLQPVNIRDVETTKVTRYLMSGAEILETDVWPGRFIPIIPVWGQEIHLGEKTVRHGIVRFAKDPQRSYNFHRSAAVETIALTPKQPFILTTDEVKGLENMWAAANASNKPYLIFNPDPRVGNQRPMRQPPTAPNIAALQEAEVSDNDMKSVTGIYDSSLGQKSNETSGKAILARERQGDVGTYVYIDNLAKAIAYCGRQLVDLIPKVYDTQRQMRILGEDGSTDFVTVNQQIIDPISGEQITVNDLSVGAYDVIVETGPSFSTKRQEAAESMMAFMQANPQAAAIIGDLIAKNMDWPGADEMAKRMRKLLPPGMAEPEEGEEPPPPPGPPPEIMAKMAELELKQQETQASIENERAKTAAKIENDRMMLEAKMQMQMAQSRESMAMKFMESQARQTPPAINVNGESMGQTMDAMGQGLAMMAQALQQLAAMQQQQTQAIVAGNQEMIAAIKAPKTLTVERGPGGLITSATQTAGNA